MRRAIGVRIIFCLVLVCSYAFSYHGLQQRIDLQGSDKPISAGIWKLPANALLALAGEFKGMVANYLVIEVGSRLGTDIRRNPAGGYIQVDKERDWKDIHQIFKASQSLDPSFAQTFMVAQGWLPWKPANMFTENQEILEKAAINRPWDWKPIHTMGFNLYYFQNDIGEAGKKYLEAANIPGAPEFLSIVGARLAQKGGQTQTAIYLLQSMLDSREDESPYNTEIVQRLEALQGTLIIEKAINGYKGVNGKSPQSLAELLESGFLKSAPKNPYGLEYCIGNDGVVYFDNPDC